MKFRNLYADEIEVRVQSFIEKNKTCAGAILLLYKDARCDMNILDETVGCENWQSRFYEQKGILFCSVGINVNYADSYKEPNWIWKDDAGSESNTEAEKGNASDSRKRAGFCWSIGRELYTSPFIYITADKFEAKSKTGANNKVIYSTNDKLWIPLQ